MTMDDPFETGDAVNDVLNDGERLFQALVEAPELRALHQLVDRLSVDDLRAVVYARVAREWQRLGKDVRG